MIAGPGRGATAGKWLACWLCIAVVASCGWHPVYAPSATGKPGVAADLATVDVALIPERAGQLLRQALQARLQHSPDAPTPEYQLQASYAETRDSIGIQPDSSVTRVRMTGRASYTLVALGATSKTCLSGTVRDVDGYDMENEQFFASDLESETVQRRLVNNLADQIVMRIARAMASPESFACAVR
jgi:LPS-assembly lipoprotein